MVRDAGTLVRETAAAAHRFLTGQPWMRIHPQGNNIVTRRKDTGEWDVDGGESISPALRLIYSEQVGEKADLPQWY